MTLEEKAKEFVSKIASGTSQEMDYYVNILVEFANEATKELQEEIEQLKAVSDYQTDLGDKYAEENKLLKTQLDALSDGVDWKGILEKNEQITELQEQIEKMKCCENCKKTTLHNVASCDEPVRIKSHNTYVCDKWKLKE